MHKVADEPIYGDVQMLLGLLVIEFIAAVYFANSFLGYRFLRFDELTVGGGSSSLFVGRSVPQTKVESSPGTAKCRTHSGA